MYGSVEVNGYTGVYGNVYELTPAGALSILYQFQAGTDGGYPRAALIFDNAVNSMAYRRVQEMVAARYTSCRRPAADGTSRPCMVFPATQADRRRAW